MSNTATAAPAVAAPAAVFHRIGEITRKLHDALQALGYDKSIEATLRRVPDAKARLAFIARLTGDAAEKVLNTVDAAQAQQDALVAQAVQIEALLKEDPVGAVARGDVLNFIAHVKSNARLTAGQLSTIMLAQDFHDLTGQTVRKIVEMATAMEEALVKLLVETAPPEQLAAVETGFLNGPVADASTRSDVVSSQAQVDELLESLGF
jgi:chemotaxis protein CheZ